MLEKLFGSRTRIKLLKLFLTNVNGKFFVREITRLTDEKINSVRRELENLLELGLIEVVEETVVNKKEENKKFYCVNNNFPLLPALQEILLKARLLVEKTLATKIDKMGHIKFLALSGFFVNDAYAPTDFLIVGQVDKKKLARLVNQISKEFGQELRYTCFSTQEFNYRNKITDKFLFEVLEGKKIVVLDNLSKE